jgi:D-threonate/D-erythronate kinase
VIPSDSVAREIPAAPRLVGLVADDLTGAADAAVQFAEEGWFAHVLMSPRARPELDGVPCLLAVVTGVRAARDDDAAAGAAGAVGSLLARGCDRLYVKVDSTMRGSVGGQLLGAVRTWAERYPGAIAVLCPAFPDEGRAVVGGTVLVDGIPLSRSAMAADPVTPVVESRLDRLIPGATAGALPDLEPAAARKGVGREGARVVFVDASTDADLDDIAAGLDRLGPQGVAAGSAGLAAAMARRWSAGSRGARTSGEPSARILVGVSSLHPIAWESVERLRKALADHGARARPAVDVLGTEGLGTDAAAIAASFGEQVAEQLARGSYDTLVLVGGDGAAAVLDRAGAGAIRVEAALAPGVPIGTVLGGAAHGVRVVTKSGGFGRPDSLLEIIDRLQSRPSPRKEPS